MVGVASRTAPEYDASGKCAPDLRKEEDHRERNRGYRNPYENASAQNGDERKSAGNGESNTTPMQSRVGERPSAHGADVKHAQENRYSETERNIDDVCGSSTHGVSPSNENKLSHSWRERALLRSLMSKSSKNYSSERPAVAELVLV